MEEGSAEGGVLQGLPLGEDQRPLVGAWSVRSAEMERGGAKAFRVRHRESGQAAELCVASEREAPELVHRLRRAGPLAARLVHPNLMRVYEAGEAGHVVFAAIETRSGETLAQRLTAKGMMSLEEALRWLEECVRGLAAAHNAGLIHGGIDPARIVLTPKCEAKIDGLYAGHCREDGPSACGSRGTADASFAAPEQLGRSEAKLTPAADLHALIACLLYAVSGKPVATGKDKKTPRLDKLCTGATERLCDLVARCLRRDPSERPVDASALLGALDAAVRRGAEDDAGPQADWDEEMTWAAGEKKRAQRASAAAAIAPKGGAASKRSSAASPPPAETTAVATDPEKSEFDASIFGEEEAEVALPETRSRKRYAFKRWISVLIGAAVLVSVLLMALPSGRETMRCWLGGEPALLVPRGESVERLFERAELAFADPLRLGQAEHLFGLVAAREPRFPAVQQKLAEARIALARQSAEKNQMFEALRWSDRAVEAGIDPQTVAPERERWSDAARAEIARSVLVERCEWNRDASRVRLVGRAAHPSLHSMSYGGQPILRGADGRFDQELAVRSQHDGIALEAEHDVKALRELPPLGR